ncbi:predicted protein, partial [Nematostella vectensis]
FCPSAQHSVYSNSIVDIFCSLNQNYEIIKKLDCPDPAINTRYIIKFTVTVQKVLLQYAENITNEFKRFCHQEETLVCSRIGCFRFFRVFLHPRKKKTISPDCSEVFKELQVQLNHTLDELCVIFVRSMHLPLPALGCLFLTRSILCRIKSVGHFNITVPSCRAAVEQESAMILQPLMDILEGTLSLLNRACEKSVLKRLLKVQLWKSLLANFERIVVLPPPNDVKGPAYFYMNYMVNRPVFSPQDAGIIGQESRNLSVRQCAVLEAALCRIKDYFYGDGSGLRKTFLEKCQNMQALRHALSLYTQTTDSLIKEFVRTQTSQEEPGIDDPVGEVSVQVDLFTHPGTGEHKVTVKVVAAKDLKWQSPGMFRPFVEVNVVGPHLGNKTRKQATKSKRNTWSPAYNESFFFILGNEVDMINYELHIAVKDYCFARMDAIVGMTVLHLRDIADIGSIACNALLGRALHMDATGWTILKILSQRSADEVARDFVALKSNRRAEGFD